MNHPKQLVVRNSLIFIQFSGLHKIYGMLTAAVKQFSVKHSQQVKQQQSTESEQHREFQQAPDLEPLPTAERTRDQLQPHTAIVWSEKRGGGGTLSQFCIYFRKNDEFKDQYVPLIFLKSYEGGKFFVKDNNFTLELPNFQYANVRSDNCSQFHSMQLSLQWTKLPCGGVY